MVYLYTEVYLDSDRQQHGSVHPNQQKSEQLLALSVLPRNIGLETHVRTRADIGGGERRKE